MYGSGYRTFTPRTTTRLHRFGIRKGPAPVRNVRFEAAAGRMTNKHSGRRIEPIVVPAIIAIRSDSASSLHSSRSQTSRSLESALNIRFDGFRLVVGGVSTYRFTGFINQK